MLLAAAAVQAQDLPDGAGKDLVINVCTVCHELTRITSKKKTKEEWNDTVDKMATRGAKASDEEFDIIVNYLTKYFGKDQAPEKSSWQPFRSGVWRSPIAGPPILLQAMRSSCGMAPRLAGRTHQSYEGASIRSAEAMAGVLRQVISATGVSTVVEPDIVRAGPPVK